MTEEDGVVKVEDGNGLGNPMSPDVTGSEKKRRRGRSSSTSNIYGYKHNHRPGYSCPACYIKNHGSLPDDFFEQQQRREQDISRRVDKIVSSIQAHPLAVALLEPSYGKARHRANRYFIDMSMIVAAHQQGRYKARGDTFAREIRIALRYLLESFDVHSPVGVAACELVREVETFLDNAANLSGKISRAAEEARFKPGMRADVRDEQRNDIWRRAIVLQLQGSKTYVHFEDRSVDQDKWIDSQTGFFEPVGTHTRDSGPPITGHQTAGVSQLGPDRPPAAVKPQRRPNIPGGFLLGSWTGTQGELPFLSDYEGGNLKLRVGKTLITENASEGAYYHIRRSLVPAFRARPSRFTSESSGIYPRSFITDGPPPSSPPTPNQSYGPDSGNATGFPTPPRKKLRRDLQGPFPVSLGTFPHQESIAYDGDRKIALIDRLVARRRNMRRCGAVEYCVKWASNFESGRYSWESRRALVNSVPGLVTEFDVAHPGEPAEAYPDASSPQEEADYRRIDHQEILNMKRERRLAASLSRNHPTPPYVELPLLEINMHGMVIQFRRDQFIIHGSAFAARRDARQRRLRFSREAPDLARMIAMKKLGVRTMTARSESIPRADYDHAELVEVPRSIGTVLTVDIKPSETGPESINDESCSRLASMWESRLNEMGMARLGPPSRNKEGVGSTSSSEMLTSREPRAKDILERWKSKNFDDLDNLSDLSYDPIWCCWRESSCGP
uniref:Chromo domain-containing protein n=1 Tax=Compsopogon caeruleus TaxID=31354 RepID=A0A7S1XFV4_9RHOD